MSRYRGPKLRITRRLGKLPSFTDGCNTGLLAAGTRSAGESRLNVPDAPSKGLLLILERGFDILNIY